MSWIINVLGKITGVSKLVKLVDGYKTKIGAASLVLSGLAEITQRAVGLTDLASVLAFARALPMSAGWVAVSAGIAAWGLARKAEKAAEVPIPVEPPKP